MEDIFQFSDYRTFLKHWLTDAQKAHPAFSLRAFSKRLGVSAAQVSLVFSGKKHFGRQRLDDLAKIMKLSPEEKEYFELLYEAAVSSPSRRKLIDLRMKSLRNGRTVERAGNIQKYTDFGWEHLFVLVSIGMKGGTKSSVAKEMSHRLAVERETIERIISDLLRSQLLVETHGRVTRSSPRFILETAKANTTMKRIHDGYLRKTADQLYLKSPADRFSATEFALVSRKSGFSELKRLSNEFLDAVTTLETACGAIDSEENEVVGISLHLNRF